MSAKIHCRWILALVAALSGCIADRAPTQEGADAEPPPADAGPDRSVPDAAPDATPIDAAPVVDATIVDATPPDAAPPDAAAPDAAPPDAAPPDAAPVPEASAGGPYDAVEGEPLEVRGSADVDIISWRWTLGDAAPVEGEAPEATLVPDADGEQPLTLVALTAAGQEIVARTTVRVRDAAPRLTWGPPAAVWAGEPVALPPIGCATVPADPLTAIEFDPGDGLRPAPAPLEHTWDAAGEVEVRARCVDEDSWVEQRFTIAVVLRDTDRDGVEDGADRCPDHPPPFTCEGGCADAFPLSVNDDPLEANAEDQRTNGALADRLERLVDIPLERRQPVVDLARRSIAFLCAAGERCVTDAEDLELALLLLDLLDDPRLDLDDRLCVERMIAFRLGVSARRLRFACGAWGRIGGGIEVVQGLPLWDATERDRARCMRVDLYNACLVELAPDMNAPRPRPAGCGAPPAVVGESLHQHVAVGEIAALGVQCAEDETAWRVDWGDGLPAETGTTPDLPLHTWARAGTYAAALFCAGWRTGTGYRVEVIVR